MFKKILLTFLLLFLMPAFAGSLDKSLDNGHNVFLYLYSPDCNLCVKFSSHYNALIKEFNGKYDFHKINVDTPYGYSLLREYRGSYLPYIVLINKKKNKLMRIHPACIVDEICLKSEMNQFRKF